MPDTKISLRPLRPLDVDDRYVSWYQNTDGHLDYYTTSGRSFSRESVLNELGRADEERKHFYAIVDSSNDLVIGNVRIGPVHPRHATADLVAFIGDRNYLGKRLASVAISEGNRLAFQVHGVEKLAGGMIGKHLASVKAYSRAGWFVEGVLRAHHVIGGIRQDFIQVACFNPALFDADFLEAVRLRHEDYWSQLFPSKSG